MVGRSCTTLRRTVLLVSLSFNYLRVRPSPTNQGVASSNLAGRVSFINGLGVLHLAHFLCCSGRPRDARLARLDIPFLAIASDHAVGWVARIFLGRFFAEVPKAVRPQKNVEGVHASWYIRNALSRQHDEGENFLIATGARRCGFSLRCESCVESLAIGILGAHRTSGTQSRGQRPGSYRV